MTPIEHASDHVLTHADLELFFSSLKTMLLKWVLGVGLAGVVAATLTFARLEGRLSAVENRNAIDSTQWATMDASGSKPVRNLAHDLGQTRREMADLQTSLASLTAVVTDLRIQLARGRPR